MPVGQEGISRSRLRSKKQEEKHEPEPQPEEPPAEEENKPRRIKNLKSIFTAENSEPKVVRKKRLEVSDGAEPIILENQPVERIEGVIRASDPSEFQKPVELEKGYTKNLATRFLTKSDEDGGSKRPFVMDLDANDAVTLENEPVVLEGVVRNADKVEDVIGRGRKGRIKNMAGKFSTGGANTDSDNEGGIVQASDGYRTEKPTFESGKARNLAERFLQQPEEYDNKKNGQSKPQWMIELENAQDGGVFENEPEVRDDVVRAEDDQPDVISVQHTRNLRAMWTQFEKEEMSKQDSPKRDILVRPKKEPTPEPEPEPEPPKNKFGQKRYGRSAADAAVTFGPAGGAKGKGPESGKKGKEPEAENKPFQKPALKSTGKKTY